MLISLSELMNTPEKVIHQKVPMEINQFEYQGQKYSFGKKDAVELTLRNLGNKKVMIEGSVDLSLVLFCSRCLADIEYPMNIQVEKEIDFNLTEEERADRLDETNFIHGYNLDVDILINNEIIINFPSKLLCSEDCKGICKQCGTNYNEGTCDCDNTDYDPRMSAIRDIFNNFKEV